MSDSYDATDERIVRPDRAQAVSAELLTVTEVAAMVRCSPRHVHRLSDAGRMPRPLKLGALVRWIRADVLAWISAGCPAVRAVGRVR